MLLVNARKDYILPASRFTSMMDNNQLVLTPKQSFSKDESYLLNELLWSATSKVTTEQCLNIYNIVRPGTFDEGELDITSAISNKSFKRIYAITIKR